MNDQNLGKRMLEGKDLDLFLEAYELATGETLTDFTGSETPDFVGEDASGHSVGIEITTLRFEHDERFLRRIYPPEPGDVDAWMRLMELIQKKTRKLGIGSWAECDRKILVIMMVDISLADLAAGGLQTDQPEPGSFHEVWLADRTQLDAFGAVDLFALAHATQKGHFATANRGQKPYG